MTIAVKVALNPNTTNQPTIAHNPKAQVSDSRAIMALLFCSLVGSIRDLRTGGHWLEHIFFQRIGCSPCYRIHSSPTAVHCFDHSRVGNQSVALKGYCAENWLEELQESMDRCTGCCDIIEINLKIALNTILLIE